MWDELDRRVRKRRNPPTTLAQLRNALIDEWNNIPMRTVNALVNSIQRRIRAATAARGGTSDIDFQFDFDFKIWGVATNELHNSRLVDHKPMKIGTFVPYMYRFVIIVKYLTNFFKLEWNLGIKFTLRFFFLSVYIFLTSGVKLHIHLLNVVVQFIVFLTLSTLICRGTDISKCLSESLGIRDNESGLYMKTV